MDYKAIYYKIIEKAKKETENGNRHVGYYERHHIQPKSLGGNNDKENIVKLTAREHFICHWLLVKIYDKGTIERNKMLCAFWRMRCTNKDHKRYINARAYEALRIEFAKCIGELSSKNQAGIKNSQYGRKWYTNRNTGETKPFREKPIEDFWIEGRKLFHGEFTSIIVHNNILHRANSLNIAKKIWDEYHAGNYLSIRDYARKHDLYSSTVTKILKRIPLFNTVFIGRSHNNQSNKKYIGIYDEA